MNNKNKTGISYITALFIVFATGVSLGACAYGVGEYELNDEAAEVVVYNENDQKSEKEKVVDQNGIADPIEPVNRAIFGFNDVFNTYVFSPVVDAYRFVIPEPLRDGVHNFLWNLKAPVVFVNELAQGDVESADVVMRRFFVNSTLGLGGLIDVASHHQLYAPLPEDMGQTFAHYGADEGFYLVVPFFGPTTLRDGIGEVIDGMVLDPFNNWASNTDEEQLIYYRTGMRSLDWAEDNLETYLELSEGTLDPYAATRSAYMQYRNRLIRDGENGDAYGNSYDAYASMDGSY